MKTGIEIIAEERQRQVEIEGWNAEHDMQANRDGWLARAGACYALPEDWRDPVWIPDQWPWEHKWWKPTPNDRVRELAKAGALIAAEIDRLNNLLRPGSGVCRFGT